MIDSDAGCDINLNPAVIGCFCERSGGGPSVSAKPSPADCSPPSLHIHRSRLTQCLALDALRGNAYLHFTPPSLLPKRNVIWPFPATRRHTQCRPNRPLATFLGRGGYLFPKMEVSHRAVVCLVRPPVFLLPPPHQLTDKWLRCLFALINELSALETALKQPRQPGFQMPAATEILTGYK